MPVSLRIASLKLNFISGASNLNALLRQSRDLTTVPNAMFVVEGAFGSPAATRHIYADDDTGLLPQPREGSHPIASHNRIHYLSHKAMHSGLTGIGLAELADHFVTNLIVELQENTAISSDDWVDIPDFYGLIKSSIFKASTTALCGPHLLALNPGFTEDFWDFDTRITGLFKRIPRWIIPKSYRVRDRLHTAIMKWHKFANEHLDWNDESLPEKQYEEYFGAKIMRSRQHYMSEIDGMRADAAAATDLGMIWG